jgi:hypothetical protein
MSGFWRRKARELSELPLWKLLLRRGTERIAARQPQALSAAAERCLACRHAGKCEELIAAGRDVEIDALCPNLMYLRHLEAMKRHEPKADLLDPPA